MITIELHFFGGAHLFTRRIPAAVERELPRVSLPDGARVDDLLALLGVPPEQERPFVNINRYYQRDNVALHDGDRIDLLMPAAGGTV